MGLLAQQRYAALDLLPRKFLKPYHHVYDELCAPAVCAMGDTLLVIGSTYTRTSRCG